MCPHGGFDPSLFECVAHGLYRAEATVIRLVVGDQRRLLCVQRCQRLGALVRALRVSAGLTQRELSAAVNISAATLRNIERGQLRIAAHLLHSLLAHQSMQQLLEMAIAAAIELAPSGELLPKARR